MSSFVTTGAMMTCTFGLTPCPLVAMHTVQLSSRPKANIMDFKPIVNIASFGMCSAPTNPTVIAATAAAMGVFTPMPCIPAITTPWMPGKLNLLIEGMPALTNTSRNMCMWAGVISFTNNGQVPIPPPICVAPPGKPIVPDPIRQPLTSADFGSGGGGGGGGSDSSKELEQRYRNDVKKAEKAGKQQEMMGKAAEKAAKASKDPQQATKAQQMADTAKGTAANQRNEAVGDVNQCYRETMPLSQKQMEQLSTEQQQQYRQQRQKIEENKQQEYEKADAKAAQRQPMTLGGLATQELEKHFADKNKQEALKQLNKEFTKATSTGKPF